MTRGLTTTTILAAAAGAALGCGVAEGRVPVAPAAELPVPPAIARPAAKSAAASRVMAAPVVASPAGGPHTSRVAIRTADGHLVTAIDGGGVGGPDDGPGSAALHTDAAYATPGSWETFECVAVGPEKLAFRTALGTYLTAVNGGGIGGPNGNPTQVHTDATKVGPWEQFDLVWLGGGKCALRTQNGHWVTAVHGGGWGEVENKFPIHTDATRIGPWEAFTIDYERTTFPRAPLAGTVRGRRFVARSAFATRSEQGPGVRNVWIFDHTASCAEAARAVEGRALHVELRWEGGGQGGATSTESSEGGRHTSSSLSAEMDDAPTRPGAQTTVALSVQGDDANVAGEVVVTACP